MQNTLTKNSILQKIWSDPDVVVFIFGGCSAEFSLNQSIDWLYFTGKLPNDPIGRLFSTLKYAHEIIFKDKEKAFSALNSIQLIHKNAELKRGMSIPNEAYSEVLDMLIFYSIKSYEILNSKLSVSDKEEIIETFNFMGESMGIQNLTSNLEDWENSRKFKIRNSLGIKPLTFDLLKKYENHLGTWRYKLLVILYGLLLPPELRQVLELKINLTHKIFIILFKLLRKLNLSKTLVIKSFPLKYKKEINAFYNFCY